ncbi:hypothetical protein ACB092_01G051500 [Castanea dentata]
MMFHDFKGGLRFAMLAKGHVPQCTPHKPPSIFVPSKFENIDFGRINFEMLPKNGHVLLFGPSKGTSDPPPPPYGLPNSGHYPPSGPSKGTSYPPPPPGLLNDGHYSPFGPSKGTSNPPPPPHGFIPIKD